MQLTTTLRPLAGALLALALACAGAARAADAGAPRESVTEELIRLLADRMALPKEDAERLIARLREEQGAAAAAAPGAPPAGPAGRVRVVYLTDHEKTRIREDVRKDVVATAKQENWALPNSFPEWARRIELSGDLRLRQEFDLMDGSNSPQFINFQSVNSGSPLNTNPPIGQPLAFPVLNSTEDRQQQRYRLRLGLGSRLTEDLSAGIRLASGNTTNPVSTNQTLGNDFNKTGIAIDRAWLNWNPGGEGPLSVWGGRMANPFASTELVWDEDLNLDGAAAQYAYRWSDTLAQDAVIGAFTVFNTDFNYPSSSLEKESSRDKWLFGAQTGLRWTPREDLAVRGAVALYDFQDIEGELSSACFAPTTAVPCDSDASRPLFLQKGNTLFALRDLVVLTPQDPTFQYFGLASPFRVLNLNGRVDKRLDEGRHLVLDADFALNLEYDGNDIESLVPVNNYSDCPAGDPACVPHFEGGDMAWLVRLLYGHPAVAERGQWNAFAGYRRLESDAVPDAFTDSDFHLGGTNAKGYYIGGNYGIARNTWLTARWLSATEVSGPPLAIDVLQLDINARF